MNKFIALRGLVVCMLIFALGCQAEPPEDVTAPDPDPVDEEMPDDEDPADEPDADVESTEAPGFDGQRFRLGWIAPLSGPAAALGLPLLAGHEAYWGHVNEELGGIAAEYEVELVTEDNRYQEGPSANVEAYHRLKDDVAMFAMMQGTPQVQAALPFLEEDGVIAAPGSFDSRWQSEQYLLPVAAPFEIEMINAAAYYVEEHGSEDAFCAMIQDDPYGEAGLRGVEFAADFYEFDVATVTRYATGDTDFTGQLTTIRNEDCDVVFLVGIPSDTANIVGAAAQLDVAPQWIGQFPTYVSAFIGTPLVDYLEEHFWVVFEGTEWGDTDDEGMKQLIQHHEQYSSDTDPDYYFVFGYAQAWAVHQLLEQAVERGDVSREGLVEAMNSMDTIEYGGLLGEYNFGAPGEREVPRASTIFRVNREVPAGLEVLSERNFVSDAAREFEL